MHTTNYTNTLVLVSPDCGAMAGKVPTKQGSVAALQYEMIVAAPYIYTSDEVLFGVFAKRKGIEKNELEAVRGIYFSKGQPCFRASPLVKTHGWGVHSDGQSRIALFGVETGEYQELVENAQVIKVAGMRSKRA